MEDFKYMLVVEVDPEIDPIAKESMEKRLGDRISSLEQSMATVIEGLNRNSLNLDTLYDRICSNTSTSVQEPGTAGLKKA